MSHLVPGIEAHPQLAARFERRLEQLMAKDACGGCKIRELVETFVRLVKERQSRDDDFRNRESSPKA